MAISVQRGTTARGSTPRILNVIIGAWLFISAFAWPHTEAQRTSTWIVGALCVFFALVATSMPWTRYLNTILAIWLFISAWALPAMSVGTMWNNAIVAIAIFVLSLVPGRPNEHPSTIARGSPPPRPA
jgi:SPW repeat